MCHIDALCMTFLLEGCSLLKFRFTLQWPGLLYTVLQDNEDNEEIEDTVHGSGKGFLYVNNP